MSRGRTIKAAAVLVLAGTLTVVAGTEAVAITPGLTNAPDAISATFRAGADPDHAAIDVKWDAQATADSGGSGSAILVTLDGVAVECLTPATGSAGPSGGTSPGGNNTATWTLICGPITEGTYLGRTPNVNNTARLVIFGDTAKDSTGTYFNGLEQVNVALHGQTTNLPDLIGVAFSEAVPDGLGNTVDKAVFTFSHPIASINAAGSFGVIPINGGDEATIADSSGPFPGDGPAVEGSTVRIFFTVGTLANAVQAFVLAEAVTDTTALKNLPGGTGSGIGATPGPVVGGVKLELVFKSSLGASSADGLLSWNASDQTKAITKFEVRRSIDGGTPVVVGTAPASARSLRVKVPFKHLYVFSVHAFDGAGFDGGASTKPHRLALVNDNAAQVRYHGVWHTENSAQSVGKELRASRRPGASVVFSFTGRDIALVATTCPKCGRAKVFIDGLRRSSVWEWGHLVIHRRIVYDHDFKTSGTHTIKIVLDGPASHPRFTVDAWIVTH